MSLLIAYNEIAGVLSVLTKDDGSLLLNHVALWNSQIENESIEHAFNYPAVFIQFTETNWRQLNKAGGFQSPIAEEQRAEENTITLHICHKHLQNETLSFPLIHEINQRVYFAVSGMPATENYGAPIRTSERQDINHDGAIDWQMDFRVTLIQTGQNVGKITVAANTLTSNISEDG